MITETIDKKHLDYISFCVDNVEFKKEKLTTILLKYNLIENMGRSKPIKEVSMTLMFSPSVDPYIFIGASAKELVLKNSYKGRCHPLLQSVNDSFNSHLPLTFSPDIIWQTIIQGVSQHINLYPEQYRKFLVKHENKKDLTIFRGDLSLDDIEQISAELPSITDEFLSLLNKETSALHFDIFKTDFSTTTQIEKTAAAITCMEAFSLYFAYQMYCGCGFPEIRLEGNINDWTKLRSKIDQIEELFYIDSDINLTWWTEKLKKLTNHFILAAQGEPIIDWWKNMYKQMNRYLSHSFNGWIGWLFPYAKTHEKWNEETKIWDKPTQEWQKNPMLENIDNKIIIKKAIIKDCYVTKDFTSEEFIFNDENQRNVHIDSFSDSFNGSCFMATDDFPFGLSKVDLKIVDSNKGSLDTILLGGFLGVTQNSDDFGLKALIGYALLK